MIQYNIYYGTIGKGAKYRFTKMLKSDKDANNFAEKCASSYYYKNEGRYGIPSFKQIISEVQLTGIDVEKLYKEHIYDTIRWYAIPTNLDTISSKYLKY